MSVIGIGRFRHRETVGLLRALLEKAEAGEIAGVAVCFKPAGAAEEFVSSDCYAIDPDTAAAATLRLSMKLASAHGEI